MEIKINEVIRSNRKKADISQEIFAEAMGVTVQAVSKWETGMSFPDITLLPKIAEYFKISIDELFFGEKPAAEYGEFPDDGRLRIVQFSGRKILSKNDYDRNVRIMLEIPRSESNEINVEIWGSADIDGDISGSVNAGDGVNCRNVGHSVTAGDGVNCGSIGGNCSAGDGINCGSIGGDCSAGDSINCGNIGQDASAGDSIRCGNIEHDANAGCDINCGDIKGNAEAANGNIHCHEIKGEANCGGNIIYEK